VERLDPHRDELASARAQVETLDQRNAELRARVARLLAGRTTSRLKQGLVFLLGGVILPVFTGLCRHCEPTYVGGASLQRVHATPVLGHH